MKQGVGAVLVLPSFGREGGAGGRAAAACGDCPDSSPTPRAPRVQPDAARARAPTCAHGSLGAQQLDHLAHGHAGGEAVWVHDQVGHQAALAEGHVGLQAGSGIGGESWQGSTKHAKTVMQQQHAAGRNEARMQALPAAATSAPCLAAPPTQPPIRPTGMGTRTWLQMDPTTPFCPCLLLNLSPSSGRRVCRTSTLTTQEQSSLLVSSTCRRAGGRAGGREGGRGQPWGVLG